MQEISHMIDLLVNSKKAMKEMDVVKLKELSNQIVHTSSIAQDEDNIIIAVLIYALSKLIERKNYYPKEDFSKYLKSYSDALDNSIYSIKKNDFASFRNNLKTMMAQKGRFSTDIKKGLEDIFRKARINKASKIYEHGISMEQTAKLLGISMWELAEYTGQTGVSDTDYSKTIDIKTRVKNAMEIFS